MAYVQVRRQRITPLIEAVQKQNVDAVRSRIQAGDELEATDSYGQTALHWATKDKSVEIVQLLLEAGADPNAKDEDGDTPLHNAQKNANPAIAEALAQLEGRSATGPSNAGSKLTASDVMGMRERKDVEGLVQVLQGDSDPLLRFLVARVLGEIGDARAVGPLRASLRDEDEDLRRAAASALEQLGVPPEVVQPLEARSLEQRPREAGTDPVANKEIISESITINRSQQEIWDYITTPQTWKMWFVADDVEDDLIDVIPDWQEGGVLHFASGQKPKINEYEPPTLLRWGGPYIRLTGIEASATKVEYGYVAKDFPDDDPEYLYEFKRLYRAAMVQVLDNLKSLLEKSDGATRKEEEQARRPPERAPKVPSVGKTAVWVEQELAQAQDAATPTASPEPEQKEPAGDDLSLAVEGALAWSQQPDRAPGESDAAYQERMAVKMAPMTEPGMPGPARPRLMRVFVSSTFHDMQAEREELVKRIFPQLRKLCEQRGVTWSEVDLRWGITSEQAAEGQVLPICLNEIQRCRPYFVGLLGERYGWVPDEIPAELVEQEPWLAQHLEHSITELEILHGVLNDPEMAEHAFFYFRDPAYAEALPPGQQGAYREKPAPDEVERYGPEEAGRRAEGRKQKLQALKDRIVESGFPVEAGYRDPVALGELVLRDMTAVIDGLFPQGSEPDPLDREALEHEAFAASRTGVYVGRQATLDRLDAHLQGDGPPLVVLGESGSGKSALLANWVRQVRAAYPQDGGRLPTEPAAVPAAMPAANPAGPGSGKTAMLAQLASQVRAKPSHDLLLVHHIGATARSADWAAMVRRIMGEFKRRLGIEGQIPGDPHELRAAFANWLHLAASRGRVVLVLDGLDQLEDRDAAPDLVWLPPEIPANVRLVLSTLPGRPLDELGKRGWPTLQVAPLEPEERQRLIVEVLALYTKALSPARIQRIAGAPQAANPLYLRALLEELRVFGLHEELDRRIDHYLAAATPRALYDKILARYEADYERHRPGLVREAMQLLWAARRGLAEAELLDLLGADGDPLPGAYWSPLYLAAEASLASRSGLIGFFHDHMRQAVGKRYLPSEEERRAAHLRLADYFQTRTRSARQVDELPWQLAQAEAWTRLYGLLGDLAFFAAAWDADPFEVKAFWAQVEANSSLRLVDAYKEAVKAPEQYTHHAWDLAILLHDTGHHEQALHLRRYLVEHLRQSGDTRKLPGALGNQAALLHDLGDLDEALILLREQERICRQQGNRQGLADSLGNQALIVQDSGDLDGALALYQQEEGICRELGDRDGLARSLGNQGTVMSTRGDLDRAMSLFQEQERLCRELGNRDGLASAVGNQGTIYLSRGDLDRALACSKEQERICRELGNRDGQAKALGNRGVILKMGGDLDGAMALTKRAERIFRDLGEKSELAGTLGQQALILRARGDLDGAMSLFKEQERISRELSNKQDLQRCLGNQALVLGDLGQLAEAMTLLKEQERICRDLDSKEGLQRSLGEQANILTDMGDLNGAMALHQEKERICRELGHPKGLAIALSNQASILAAWGRPRKALPLAEEAVRLLTSHGFTRIAAQVMPGLQEIRSLAGSPGQGGAAPSQPASAGAHHNQAVKYADQGRLDEAIREYQAALRIQPDLAEAHHGLGLVYGRQGLVPEAMSEFQAALRLKPDYAEAHYNLGVLYAGQGRLDEAMGEWQATLRVEPDHVGARCNLGVAYGMQGRLEEAAREYKAALDSKPDCAEAHYNLGVNYGTRGMHDQALREFQAAVRIKSDYVEAHNNLAQAYWQGGRREDAIQQWKTAAQLGSAQARQVLAQLGQD